MAKDDGKDKFLTDPKFASVRDAIGSIVDERIDEKVKAARKKKSEGNANESDNIFDQIFGGFGSQESED